MSLKNWRLLSDMGGCVLNCLMYDYISKYITTAARINFTVQRAANRDIHSSRAVRQARKPQESRLCDFDHIYNKVPPNRTKRIFGAFLKPCEENARRWLFKTAVYNIPPNLSITKEVSRKPLSCADLVLYSIMLRGNTMSCADCRRSSAGKTS